jgi:two-component system chemotaxis response regulator CheB
MEIAAEHAPWPAPLSQLQASLSGGALRAELWKAGMPGNRRIRILIVDDSAIVRKILPTRSPPNRPGVGTAPDPYVARDKILALKPDVLAGYRDAAHGRPHASQAMHFHPLPTVVISSPRSLPAPRSGAGIRCGRGAGQAGGPYSVEASAYLAAKVPRPPARVGCPDPLRWTRRSPVRRGPVRASAGSILAIGASTGN